MHILEISANETSSGSVKTHSLTIRNISNFETCLDEELQLMAEEKIVIKRRSIVHLFIFWHFRLLTSSKENWKKIYKKRESTKTQLFTETLAEDILTVALKETEFEYQHKSDQIQFLASFAHQVSVASKLNSCMAIKWLLMSWKMLIDTLMEKIRPVVLNNKNRVLRKTMNTSHFLFSTVLRRPMRVISPQTLLKVVGLPMQKRWLSGQWRKIVGFFGITQIWLSRLIKQITNFFNFPSIRKTKLEHQCNNWFSHVLLQNKKFWLVIWFELQTLTFRTLHFGKSMFIFQNISPITAFGYIGLLYLALWWHFQKLSSSNKILR